MTAAHQEHLTIAKASRSCGLPVKTLRYYDEIDLVRPKHRSPAGYRLYGPEDLRRLSFLQRARSFGFSIDACRDLLSLQTSSNRDRGEVRAIAEHHLAEINARLAALTLLKAQLEGLVADCKAGQGPECPILIELEDGPERDPNARISGTRSAGHIGTR